MYFASQLGQVSQIERHMCFILYHAVNPQEATPYYSIKNMECNFDDDLCSWEQDEFDYFDWTRAYSTSTAGTGPSGDHTTGSGKWTHFQ